MSQIPSQESQSPGDTTEQAERTRRVTPPRGQSSTQRRPSAPRYRPPEGTAPPPPPAYPVGTPPAVQPRRRQPRSAPPSESGLYLPWWSLVIMVGVVGVLAFGLLLAFTELAAPQTPGDQAPRVQVITSQPTLSQDFSGGAPAQPQFWPTAIPQAQPTATVPLPTPIPSPSLPPGQFDIGAQVQVVGVDTNGLNVRAAPGYSGSLLFLGIENEIFVIVGGPQSADDLEWWKIQDPDDPDRTGWAARNYLMAISQ